MFNKLLKHRIKMIFDPNTPPEEKEELARGIKYTNANGFKDTFADRMKAHHLWEEKQRQLKEMMEQEAKKSEEKPKKKYERRRKTVTTQRGTKGENKKVGVTGKKSGRNR